MSSTGTALSIKHFNELNEQQLMKQLRYEYNVDSVVKDYYVSKELMAELFLLGVSFSTEIIRGRSFKVMILKRVMYILNGRDDSLD